MDMKIIASIPTMDQATASPVAFEYDQVAREFIDIIHDHGIRDHELSLFLDIRATTQQLIGHMPNGRNASFRRSVLTPSFFMSSSWTAFCAFSGVTPHVPLLFTAGTSFGILLFLFCGAALLRKNGEQLLSRIVQDLVEVIKEKDSALKGVEPTPRRSYLSAVRQIKELVRGRGVVLSDDMQRLMFKQAILRADRALSLEQIRVLLHDCRLE